MFLLHANKTRISLYATAWIVLLLCAVTPLSVRADSNTVDSLYRQTNQYRTEHNVRRLSVDPKLEQAAQKKAEHIIARQYWSHIAPSGETPWDFIRAEGYTYEVAGENLAHGFEDTRNLFTAWTQSPTHNDNLIGDFSKIGIASVKGSLFGEDTTLVVAMYATPKSQGVTEANINSLASNHYSQLNLTMLPYIFGGVAVFGARSLRFKSRKLL